MSELCFAVSDPPDGSLANVHLTLTKPPDRNGVIVSFNGIAGNRPLTFGNYLALWDTDCPIIGVDEPVAIAPIESNLQPGTVQIDYGGFTEGDYLVTYQAGSSLQAMCADLRIPVRLVATPPVPTSCELSVASVTTTSVELLYNTIAGYRPRDYGNWVGIWQGNPVAYAPADPPLGHATFADNATQGLVTLAGMAIDPRFNYTVIYFLSGADTLTAGRDVAATLTFVPS